ncbi:MAG: endolytic transglycosylase MltG [Gammaproteobacteria bacterium]
MKWKWFLITLFALLILSCTIPLRMLHVWWRTPVANPYLSVYVDIKPGSSLKRIANQLYYAGLIDRQNYFIWQVRLHAGSQDIKAGEYIFKPSLTPEQIYQQLKSAKVIQHAITLVEGLTFNQFMAELATQTMIKHDLQGLTLSQIMQKMGSSYTNAEGLFYPNTYFYVQGTTESALLSKAYQAMQSYINQAWPGRSAGLPYQTPYQALIVASLIEKETANPQERPLVASVIINRLNKGMPLQIDPTVIYGIGTAYNGDITSQDLKQDTAYNTYLHAGLPPTPIAMPSAASIDAALHPANTNYLYFVAIGDGSGNHQFSENLAQHNAAVKSYLKTLKPKPTLTPAKTLHNASTKSVPAKTSHKASTKSAPAKTSHKSSPKSASAKIAHKSTTKPTSPKSSTKPTT